MDEKKLLNILYYLAGQGYGDNTVWEIIDQMERKKENGVTYGEIFKKFQEKMGMDDKTVIDYRPCAEPYYHTYIPNAIIVWLNNGDHLIYIHEEVTP